jgi:D-arginine dehydrogenase
MTDKSTFDIAIIGAGIAGASVAAQLAGNARVALIEMESEPGYHTTGRSAALYTETYGPAPIRALTRASGSFLTEPPSSFADHSLLSERGVLMLARNDQVQSLEALIDEVQGRSEFVRLSAAQTRELAPLVKAENLAGSAYETGARDIDVNGLHQGFLRQFRRGGGELIRSAPVTGLSRSQSGWTIQTKNQELHASVVVNAAGAWADEVGAMAGAITIGLVPKRRTGLIIATPDGMQSTQWPVAIDIDESFYMRPDAGRLMISPADETPSAPCDAQPDEMDVAVCVDRIERAFDVNVKRIENQWAGLRSFVADKSPVCGFDSQATNFFWLAGQGGYGIQTSPALARVAAALIQRNPIAQDITDQEFDSATVSPDRLV